MCATLPAAHDSVGGAPVFRKTPIWVQHPTFPAPPGGSHTSKLQSNCRKWPRARPSETTLHLVSCVLRLLRTVTVSQISLSLMTLTVLRSIRHIFCRMSLKWDLSDVFLMIRVGWCVLGERPQRRKAIFITITARVCALKMPYCCWC